MPGTGALPPDTIFWDLTLIYLGLVVALVVAAASGDERTVAALSAVCFIYITAMGTAYFIHIGSSSGVSE